MDTQAIKHSFRIMVLISKRELSEKVSKLLKDMDVPVHYELNVEGTVPSEMMDILALADTDWSMVISMVPKALADKVFKKCNRTLMLGTVNSGIAFTIPMNGSSGRLYQMLCQLENDSIVKGKDDNMATEYTNSAVITIVKQGYSDKVMNAARKAGARGGTVLHSRKVGELEVLNAWGLSLQEETDLVLIIADSGTKKDIMQAIAKECGIQTDAKGLVVSLPIDSVIGISAPEDDE